MCGCDVGGWVVMCMLAALEYHHPSDYLVALLLRFSPGVDTEDAVLHTIAVPVKWNKSLTTSSYLVRRETTSWNVTKTRAIPKEMLSAMCVR